MEKEATITNNSNKQLTTTTEPEDTQTYPDDGKQQATTMDPNMQSYAKSVMATDPSPPMYAKAVVGFIGCMMMRRCKQAVLIPTAPPTRPPKRNWLMFLLLVPCPMSTLLF
jgi:hypothetical protein